MINAIITLYPYEETMDKTYYEFITGEAFESIVREEVNNNNYIIGNGITTPNEILKTREGITLISNCLTIALQTLGPDTDLKLYLEKILSAFPILTSEDIPDME